MQINTLIEYIYTSFVHADYCIQFQKYFIHRENKSRKKHFHHLLHQLFMTPSTNVSVVHRENPELKSTLEVVQVSNSSIISSSSFIISNTTRFALQYEGNNTDNVIIAHVGVEGDQDVDMQHTISG